MKVAVSVRQPGAGADVEVHVVEATPETSVRELKALVAARLPEASREALAGGEGGAEGAAAVLVYGEELCRDERTMADFGLGERFIRLVRARARAARTSRRDGRCEPGSARA